MNSPGRDNGDHSSGSFGDPDDNAFPAVIVPDDISALDDEVRAYRREVARAQARAKRRTALGAPLRALARFGHWLARMFRYVLPW